MKEDQGQDTFTVHYGRVGGRSTMAVYPISQWNKKYNEKIRKGYKDQTDLFIESEEEEIEFTDISDATVKQLVTELMAYATKSIGNNYNVTADQVTSQQVNKAQATLDDLVKRVKWRMNKKAFNSLLLELYQIIPRKMNNVSDHLVYSASTKEEREAIRNMLANEQDTLDVMRGQVNIKEQQKEKTKEVKSINLLEAMGLTVEPVKDRKTIKMIKGKMQDQSQRFERAFKVVNLSTQKRFDGFLTQKPNQKTELFWHGSRNENWMSIMENGLVLRPASAVITGKMFGYGLYFADKFQKSLNYSSVRGAYWSGGNESKGFLALYEVHTGEALKVKHHEGWCYEMNETQLKKMDAKYDSLFAEGGADLINNEYIIYNQSQCTIQYLVEVNSR